MMGVPYVYTQSRILKVKHVVSTCCACAYIVYGCECLCTSELVGVCYSDILCMCPIYKTNACGFAVD